MSNRTALASKAIREAWEREKELVSNGQGTRDWTRKQQQDILEKGKAYDEDGKAMEGHHMKSAEKYPKYQGDSDNIQFLTRAEHKDAHGGDFHNPTNGYYDYITKKTTDFGDKKYIPCKKIELTAPIKKKKSSDSSEKLQNPITKNQGTDYGYPEKKSKPKSYLSKKPEKSFIEKCSDVLKDPDTWEITAKAALLTKYLIDSKSNKKQNIKEVSDNITTKDYPENRSSPRQHDVSGYNRQNGTHVNGYTRGGKK